MPAKKGKAAMSMPARLAATSAMPEAQQPKEQDAQQDAGEQPSLQVESSTGTLDFTATLHRREQSRASEDRPWVEAFFVEERHVITEPLHLRMHEDALHASSEASLYIQRSVEAPCSSNSLSAMDDQERHLPRRHVLDQLEQDSEEDLAAALKATAACTPLASWQRVGGRYPVHLDVASGVAAAPDSAGLDVIPDTVQTQDAALDERSMGGHELHSSSKRQDAGSGRHCIPDSLDDSDHHLQLPSAMKGLQDMR